MSEKGGGAAGMAGLCGALLALALVLSYAEAMIPIPIPVPGAKLGLANLVTVVGLYTVGTGATVIVSLARILLVGLTFGNLFSMLYGLGGWALSIGVMVLLRKGAWFSPLGVSATGGAAHNLGQLIVAAMVVRTWGVFVYFPLLLAAGVAAGALIGILGGLVAVRLGKARGAR
ncbi:MAG: Gx transporter family protein [Lachnospiraceae bacterium]|jgi:heptaprenyl diphosphate synthase|nr:Gx transporter family protein [Lachnospiraceae bacterium]